MLKKWLKKSFLKGILRFLPLAIASSAADGALLWGIRSFMDLLSQESPFTLTEWVALMVLLTALRLIFLFAKVRQNETWIFQISSSLRSWFIRKLRNLSPRFFHDKDSGAQTEMAFDAIHTIQSNGTVFFQATQAALQLLIFIPVLLYISWPLTLFLFLIITPLVAWLQRKIHRMGPEEESLLFERSKFRNNFDMTRRLFRTWSAPQERAILSSNLQKNSRELTQNTKRFSIRKNGLSLVMESVSVLSMIFVLTFCAILIARGWMDSKGLILFCSAVLLSYKPVKECSRALPEFRALVSACHFLFKFETVPEKSPAPAASGESLSVRQGAFSYGDANTPETIVYRNLNLNWSVKQPVLLKGKNGAGKTTLFRLIANLEEWNQGDICGPYCSVPDGIFLMSQDLELPPKSILKDLLARSQSPLLQDFIETFRIQKLLSKEALSGGERAKVALLWALASPSKVVLLDEPLAGIALADRAPILEKLLETCEKLGKWLLISSHDRLPETLENKFLLVDLDYEKNL
jgi:ABC-type multidrug transport system fused ATPase/permease subunit